MRIILLILLIGINSCREKNRKKETTPVQEQKTIAAVKLSDLDGQPISLEQFKGRTVFINFWATWCKPCIQEMPSIDSAQKLLSKSRIVFLLASAETPDQIKEFKQHYLLNSDVVRLANMEELNMDGLPTTYIYNPKGEIAFAETGYRKWNDSSNIEMILKINNQK
jgi:thiol-disulfide isomerase/thioredoxin